MNKKHMIAVPLAVMASMGMTSAAQADHFMGDQGRGVQVEIDTSGSTGGIPLNKPIVGFSPSRDGGTTITVTAPGATVAIRGVPGKPKPGEITIRR